MKHISKLIIPFFILGVSLVFSEPVSAAPDPDLVAVEAIDAQDTMTKGTDIVEYAKNFLGRPYRSGSKGPKSFDCSGFTSYVFRNFDLRLGASSRDQYRQGVKVSRDNLQPGDLLFFSGSRKSGTVGHVGIVTEVNSDGSVKFIHAARKGGIRFDRYPDGGYYSSRYIGARRVH
ncbi:MAG: C40 family peptidase [Muribaculaceae bacterium]|nr:C40 family peptidase [Muribaculaceae bacterium]